MMMMMMMVITVMKKDELFEYPVTCLWSQDMRDVTIGLNGLLIGMVYCFR